ncbi:MULTISPECIES: hypothetical protein [Lysinibacillus]|uniref:Uncharacterized protein n=1 Tax=Lysinibacillus antri TaxID=2498145 RepID=A0A3S0QNN9_9BACI|nr:MULTISPECIES: hypothetical protein [Lysinibacillus]RUL49595.1 hypothetical protein EK386_15000 [Lysinibacillus antri]TSI02266.1 hypothetical protein FJQ64_19020 [Lysinibacillus sp. BW-2-10]
MDILYIFFLITVSCLIIALWKKRFALLIVPIIVIALYMVVEVILVPAPLLDTVKFIFSLQ